MPIWFRSRPIKPISRASKYGPNFTRRVNEARRGGAMGYDIVGRAVGANLLQRPSAILPVADLPVLGAAIAAGDTRAIVRLLVRRARWVMRRIPRARRYASFETGLREALDLADVGVLRESYMVADHHEPDHHAKLIARRVRVDPS